MNREEAIKATRVGAIAACVSAAVTGIAFSIATLKNVDRFSDFGYLNDPAFLFDVGLLLVLAWFIYKKSRVASVFILVYFIGSKFYMFLETGKVSGIALSALFIYFYARAALGAFIYHKDEKQNNPDYKNASKWVLIPSIVTAFVFFGLIAIGMLTMTSAMLPTEVMPGDRLNESHVEKLVDTGLVNSAKEIELFYSSAMKNITDEGAILQKDKVVLYLTADNGDFESYEIYFKDITSVTLIEEGGLLADSVYRLSGDAPENWMQIPLSKEKGGDKRFIDIVKSRMSK